MSDGYEPHSHILVWDIPVRQRRRQDPVPAVRGRVYPGWCGLGGREGVLPGYYPATLQDPYSVIFSLRALPTAKQRQIKVIYEVSEIGVY